MSKVEETIWKLAEPVALECGVELVEVEYVKEGTEWFLRLYIDKEMTSVELDDCEAVSRKVSEILDKADPIEQAYRLEVSSPGIERPLKRLKDFERFKGEKVRARAFSPINGQKEFIGILGGADDDNIVLDIDGQEILLERKKISRVNLVWEF